MIEKMIQGQLEEIFGGSMSEGHRLRFEAKLETAMQHKERQKNNVRRLIIWTAAAAACLAIVITLNINVSNDTEEPFAEVHNYYSMLLEEEMKTTMQALDNMDDTYKTEVWQDIETLLGEPIPFREDGEQNTSLMIAAYSSKIEALQQIKNNIQINN